MSNKMLIDSSHPEETRVVVAKGNRLEDFDFESQHKKQIRGNIYLAKVTRVEPSLQAAFVDYGGNRHGFLAFSEIHPDYYQIPLADRQALLEEEAALAAEEDEDDEREVRARAPREKEKEKDDDRGGKRRRRRRGRRGPEKSERSASRVPDAEPVAMDEILAAWEAAQADRDNGSDADEDEADEDATVIAAATDGAAVISEAVSVPADDNGGNGDEDDDDDDDDSEDEEIDTVAGGDDDDAIEERRPRRTSRRQYKIQEVIKRRQVILVQVVKEERGNKGAALTTYMSLAGRYSVLMPNTARGGGISRKITNAADRKRLKDVVKELDVPKGMGVILRTAGANRTRNEINRDYDYLMRLWDNVRDLTLASTAPALVYEEGSLIKRSIRDLYNKDISEIVVAGEQGYREAKDFMRMLMPGHAKIVKPWRDTSPIFARTGMEAQLDKLIHPQVTLKSGGYIIINQTEALVSIDVNSGKSTREHSIEETAVATNLEAAEEVARQLRLRDLAGLIVIDFIDMEENRNKRAVEKKLKECLKNDRARIQVGRISHFGLLEMSRQRMRASVLESTMQVCPHCNGTGLVRSPQSNALHVIRSVEDYLIRNDKNHITVRTAGDTALYLLNTKRETLVDMEQRFGLTITISIDDSVGSELFAIDRGEISDLPKRETTAVSMGYDDADDDEDDDIPMEEDEETVDAVAEVSDDEDGNDSDGDDNQGRRKRRRRRRGGKNRNDARADDANASDDDGDSDGDDDNDADGDNDSDDERGGRRKRRSRGRRGGRNRRGREARTPDAEPVGEAVEWAAKADVLAQDAIEAGDNKGGEVSADNAADMTPAEAEAKAEETVVEVQVGDEGAKGAEITGTQDEAAAETESAAETDTDQPRRVRATAATIDLEAEPVVVTSNTEPAAEKPKRAGWWSKKGFF